MGNGPYSFAQRSRTLQNGLTDSDFAGKPVIAIVNTWSDVNTRATEFENRQTTLAFRILKVDCGFIADPQ